MPQPSPARAHRPAPRPARTPRARRLLLALLALLLALTACAPSLPDPPPPPGSSPYSGEGPLASVAQLAFANLHSHLTRYYEKPWDIRRHAIPPNVDWEAVTAHYAEALGSDWKVDTRYPEWGPGYRRRVWSANGRAVAVGMVRGLDPSHESVLVVLVPRDEN